MKVSPIDYPIAALIMINALFFLFIYSTLDVTLNARFAGHYTAMAPTPMLGIVVPMFEKVMRRDDSSVTRLFGPSIPEDLGGKALAGPAQQSEPTFRLIGVISNEENIEEQIAVLDRGGPNGVMRLHLGSKIIPQGWQVEKITPRSVVLSRGEERQNLRLE